MKPSAAESLHVLVELTRELTEHDHDLDVALQRVTDAALQLLHAQHASLRLLDEAGEQLLSGARSGAGRERAPTRLSKGEGIAGWVISQGDGVLSHDVHRDERFVDRAGQGYEIGSMASVPVWSSGKVIGALTATSPSLAHFDHEDMLRLRLLANCAAPALEVARLKRLAITDAYTGALNQSQLIIVLQRLMDDPETGALSVLELDLDHFKRVNDTYGHAVGDDVLREFVLRVRDVVRVEDVIVRRGGEEFIVALPRCELSAAIVAAQRIRQAMANAPVLVDVKRVAFDSAPPPPLEQSVRAAEGELSIHQRVSIGVAQWDGKESPQELEQRVDAALYAAKNNGRNRVETA